MASSRTPLFDQAIERLFTDAKPGQFVCQETGETFERTEEDIELYRSLKLCPSRLSPHARFRRIASRVGGFELHKRIVQGQEMISVFDPESPTKLIPSEEFFGDAFDACEYGVPYDVHTSFFEQWKTFSLGVPRPVIFQDPASQNSPWALYDLGFKNCYFTYAGLEIADCCYADLCVSSSHLVDATNCVRTEWSYECVACVDCSRLAYSERCMACQRLYFCADCRDCQDCFGCINLRNKQFCFLNEQLDEATYKQKVASLNLRDPKVIEAWRQRVRTEIWNPSVRRAGATAASEYSHGDDLVSCRNVDGVDIVDAERVRSSTGLSVARDCIDMLPAVELERCASGMFNVNGYENIACVTVQDCVQVEYSESLFACSYCFGCIGIHHKKYCVFNVQYTEDEYWSLVDRIKAQMVKEGVYGEPLPYNASLFSYNGSFALAIDPLTRAQAEQLGARWFQFPEVSGIRPFRTVKPEEELIELLGVALPTEHPTTRRLRRMKDLQPFTLVDRVCMRCKTSVRSRFRQETAPQVVCERCYEELMLAA